MKPILRCILIILGVFLDCGCNQASASKKLCFDAQLLVIKDAVNHSLHMRKVDIAVSAELAHSQELLRFTATSLKCGFGETESGGVAFEDSDKAKLAADVAGVEFYFIFQNETEYVLISNLYVPHIDNFRPMASLGSTNGFYLLRIRKTVELTEEVEEKLRMFAGEGARIRGTSNDLESTLRALYDRGIKIQATTYDGARIDIIDVHYTGHQLVRQIINPIRPDDSTERYVDADIEAVDSIFRLLWSHFM